MESQELDQDRPSIVFEDVAKTFVSRERVTEALLDVSFVVENNQFVSIIGPSGCGKTTILKMIADLIVPTKGVVRVLGDLPTSARRDRQLGIVFQQPTLLEWRTVLDNVLLPQEVFGDGRQEQVARDLLRMTGLEGFESHYPDELSGGMQQRVAIARALSYSPSILLMDEPFGALDLITRDKMGLELLEIWQHTQRTVVFVTHSVQEAVLLSDKVLVLSSRPGTIIKEVTVDLSRPRPLELRETNRFQELTNYLRKLLT